MTTAREALMKTLEREFGPFLAHWPHNPDKFFGQSADAILSAFPGIRDVIEGPNGWEWGVRHVAVDGWPHVREHPTEGGARQDFETCGMNCAIVRRRSAGSPGPWEVCDESV